MRRSFSLLVLLATGALVVATAAPAGACGGLVAPNGAVRLDRTTTLAAYHDGVEHYVTSFQYAGGGTNFGSIIPLPGVPSEVKKAGSWTLQRLEREVNPPRALSADAGFATSAAPAAQVLLQTTVDALDITVLKGGGPEVLAWVKAHGYAVSNDAPAMLDFYASRSPIFLAARFDATKAAARQEQSGDGTPIQITIPTPNPWVPLHILSLAKVPEAPVVADVFLLTDHAPALLGLDGGVQIQAGEPASASLLSDLRSDQNSEWIPGQGWLSYITINTSAGQLNHDLAIDVSGAGHPSVIQAGFQTADTAPAPKIVAFDPVTEALPPGNRAALLLGAGFALLLIGGLGGWTIFHWSRRPASSRNGNLT
jgi:hypothetical protein